MVKDNTGFYRSGYSMVLLFAFMLGAIMTVLYLPQIKDLSVMHEDFTTKIFVLLTAAAGILASSVCGLILLPCTCVFMGSAAALEIDMISNVLAQGENPEGLRILLLLVFVPLHFVLCGLGMNNSALIRQAVKAQGHYARDLAASYIIMLIGIILSLILFWYIMNYK